MENVQGLTFAELLDGGAADAFLAGPWLLEHPAVGTPERQRELIAALFEDARFHGRSVFGRNARKQIVHVVVQRRDAPTLALLVRLAGDPTHPLRLEALEELLATRDRAIIAPLYDRHVPAVLDGQVFESFAHRLAQAATFVMGIEAVHRELVPRYLTAAAIAADPAAGPRRASELMFELLHQVGAGVIPRDDAALAQVILALPEHRALAIPRRKLLAALKVAAASPPPVAKKRAATKVSYLKRYRAGEHRAVWDELRALGPNVREHEADARAVAAETMKRFLADVAAIEKVLRGAGYPFAEKKVVRPARKDAKARLAALGVIPIALEALYSACDGVSLAQDVEVPVDGSPVFGPGVLDELGRCDPLIVAPLAQLTEHRTDAGLYLAPDPACRGTIEDEIPDEHPVRLVITDGMDGQLAGEGSLVDWLRAYVEAGGFRGLEDEAERDKLRAGSTPF